MVLDYLNEGNKAISFRDDYKFNETIDTVELLSRHQRVVAKTT